LLAWLRVLTAVVAVLSFAGVATMSALSQFDTLWGVFAALLLVAGPTCAGLMMYDHPRGTAR
jgi:hypothetical protein